MKREDIKRIFEGATDEQINEVLNINSSDIGAEARLYLFTFVALAL